MKPLSKIIILVLGCSSASLIGLSFGKQEMDKQALSEEASPLGAYSNPIVWNADQFKNYDQVEYEQQDYIRKHYEDYKCIGNSFTKNQGRFLFGFLLKNDQREIKSVYFDMTDIYKKFRKQSKYKNRIKDLEKQYSPKHISK